MIQLTKDTGATPTAYSSGTGAAPVAVAIALTGTNSPTTKSAIPADPLYVWANDDTTKIDNYSDIDVTIVGSDTGITWELSLDGSTGWASTIALPTMDVSVSHATTRIYARATALNDGSIATSNYVTAAITITATENPA